MATESLQLKLGILQFAVETWQITAYKFLYLNCNLNKKKIKVTFYRHVLVLIIKQERQSVYCDLDKMIFLFLNLNQLAPPKKKGYILFWQYISPQAFSPCYFVRVLKFINSEKATKFCEISTICLTGSI